MRAIFLAVVGTLPGVFVASESVAWRVVSIHDGDAITTIDQHPALGPS